MSKTRSELYFEVVEKIDARSLEISKSKNKDYTGDPNDPFGNFKSVENIGIVSTEKGFLTRMMDKIKRINSLVEPGAQVAVKDEALEDTLLDLANYAKLFYGYLVLEKKHGWDENAIRKEFELPMDTEIHIVDNSYESTITYSINITDGNIDYIGAPSFHSDIETRQCYMSIGDLCLDEETVLDIIEEWGQMQVEPDETMYRYTDHNGVVITSEYRFTYLTADDVDAVVKLYQENKIKKPIISAIQKEFGMVETLNEYQEKAKKTAIYPDGPTGLTYTALGLAGEAGEVANDVKKWIRDDNSSLTPERRNKLIDEMGDVLWYLASLSKELDTNLQTVAQRNLDKLHKKT